MYIVFIPRVGLPHILNFVLSTGKYRMLCGKDMPPNSTINSFAGDVVFPGVCPVCAKHAIDMYEDDLISDVRFARNSWQGRLMNLRDHHYEEILGPFNHVYTMEQRNYQKVERARKKIKQRKK